MQEIKPGEIKVPFDIHAYDSVKWRQGPSILMTTVILE